MSELWQVGLSMGGERPTRPLCHDGVSESIAKAVSLTLGGNGNVDNVGPYVWAIDMAGPFDGEIGVRDENGSSVLVYVETPMP